MRYLRYLRYFGEKLLFLIRWLFSNAENVHYLALSVAVAGGAVWALYTFDVLHQRDIAVKQLEEIQARIDGNNASNIQISPKVTELGTEKFGLIVNVLIQNTGTHNVMMSWEDRGSPLAVYKMEVKKGDEHFFKRMFIPKIYAPFDPVKKHKEHYNSLYVLVGAKKELSFNLELKEKGLYYITFNAEIDEKLNEEIRTDTGKAAEWFSSKYIYVEN